MSLQQHHKEVIMNETEVSYALNEKKPSARSGFLRSLMRLILVLFVGLLLGAGLYYLGSVYLYWQAIQPAQSSAARLTVLETSIAADQQQSDERISQFNQRLTELEKQHTLDAEALAELQSSMSSLSKGFDSHTSSLKRLDELSLDLEKLTRQTTKNQEGLADLQKTLKAEDAPLAVLGRELNILKAMELLSRSRLNLIQNNAGLARQDIEAARQLLFRLREEVPEDHKQIVTLWVQRLELALANLKDAPVVAATDLEIAWSLLGAGFSPPMQLETLPTLEPVTPEATEVSATPSSATPTPKP
jgi:hypothetical protein